MVCRFIIPVLLLGLCGCSTTPRSLTGTRPDVANADSFLPRVAVMPFENRSNFSGQWALGSGFADLLTTYLLHTGRLVVLERNDLPDVLDELTLQRSGVVRPEGRAEFQRIKNAEYLIRGVITEFTVTRDTSGWFSKPEGSLWTRGRKARVSLNIKVTDAETGEVMVSVESAGDARSGLFGGDVTYRDLNFGGEAFYRTPLGKATRQAMGKAINEIVKELPRKRWKGRVAHVEAGQVIINGGTNVGVREGQLFEIRGAVQAITDPISGNVLRELPGRVVGRIRIHAVDEQSASGRLIEGVADRGSVVVPSE